MIRPNFLKSGDKVLLISPAGSIEEKSIFPAIDLFKNWGLNVEIAPHSFCKYYRFSGTILQRTSDMQNALDSIDIKAIICNRGGYGSINILENLDFSHFKRNPKWLIGFSDITVFHNYFNRVLRCETLHAPMPITLSDSSTPKETLEYFRKAIFGEEINYCIPSNHFNIIGEERGEIIGGNLAILNTLLGTNIAYNTKGKILFIEDIDEPIHKIEQMIWKLKYLNKLKDLKGLIVGGFTKIDTNPELGKTVNEIIYDAVSSYKYPVCFDFPVGHIPNNYPIYVGRKVVLKVTENNTFLNFNI